MANYSLGREQIAWIAEETTFGTIPGSASVDSFVYTDAVRVITATCNAKTEKESREDRDNSNTLRELIQKRRSGSFNVEMYLTGAGTNTTAPDWAVMAKSIFGTAAASGSDGYVFTPATDPATSFAILLDEQTNRNYAQLALGCVAKKMTVKGAGDDVWKVTFEGACADVINYGRATVNVAATAADTSLTCSDTSGIEAGGVLSVGSFSGEQLLVTAVSTSANTLTVTRAWGATAAASIASSSVLVPWSPALASASYQTTGAIAGRLGSLTIQGTTVTMKNMEISMESGVKLLNDHIGTNKADAYVFPEKRKFIVQSTLRLERALAFAIIGMVKNHEQMAVVATVGDTSGNKFETRMTTAELMETPDINYPARDTVDVTLTMHGISATDNAEGTFAQV